LPSLLRAAAVKRGSKSTAVVPIMVKNDFVEIQFGWQNFGAGPICTV
jgi:hypothetical protein